MRNSFIYVCAGSLKTIPNACAGQKPLLDVCVGDNPTSFSSSKPAKKDAPAYLMGVVSIKKLNTLNMATINKTLINSGLSYAVKRVKGVFHRLNSLSVRAVAPMFGVLGLANCLIYSGLNSFSGLSKNLFLFV
jgi:hypothetical protein